MKEALEHIPCAVLTISDSRTEETDASGRIIVDSLEGAEHRVVEYRIVPDSVEQIEKTLRELMGREDVKVIIMNGGTGITSRDVTPEAVTPFLEKRLDGFGELFRFLSYEEIGPAAMMSRALAGVSSGKMVICLPGSRGAVSLAMERMVLPQVGHMMLEVEK
jgi:molybdenum cofactor biosynthesis protein B